MNASRLANVLLISAVTVAWVGCGTKERTPLELAEYTFSLPDYEKALEACDAAFRQADSDVTKATIHVLRGRCYVGQGRSAEERQDSRLADQLYEKSIVEFSAALDLQHECVDALHNRRMAYRLTKQPELAAKDYTQIRKLDPIYQTAYQIEPTEDILIRKRSSETPEEEEVDDNRPDESSVVEETPLVEPRKSPAVDKAVVQSDAKSNGEPKLGPKISVADFEPSGTDPSSRLSQWLSQHEVGASLGQPGMARVPSDGALMDINPDESNEADDRSNDNAVENEPVRRSANVPAPSNWPSSSQWPQFASPHTPSLPTGIVGPDLHPPANNQPTTLPYRGIVAPTGSTGVGAEPTLNRSAPYTNQTLPTTGITGAFSPYRARGSAMVPYRPAVPEALRQQQQPDATDPRNNSRIPRSLQPNAPKLPTSPRPRLQYQTSPLSPPTIRPGS